MATRYDCSLSIHGGPSIFTLLTEVAVRGSCHCVSTSDWLGIGGERKSIIEERETFSLNEGINTALECST